MMKFHRKAAVVAPTLYAVLGMPPGLPTDALHQRYLELAFELHPDRNGDEEKFKELTAAWAMLKDPARRRQYDAQLRLAGGQCKACLGAGLSWGTRPCRTCNGTGQERGAR